MKNQYTSKGSRNDIGGSNDYAATLGNSSAAGNPLRMIKEYTLSADGQRRLNLTKDDSVS